ncbi:MAG: Crp/Fnr family transcriptional regulator [Candidatus Dormibacteria bacterium]
MDKIPQRKKMLGTWRIDPSLARRIIGLANCGKPRKFRKHEMLYEQGTISTKFYFILSGLVQVSMLRVDGVEVVLEYMSGETICGEGSAFDGLPRFSGAVAVEDTQTIEFDAGRMEEVFKKHPEFASVLLRVTSLKQRVLAVRLEHLASRRPEVRIMDLLRRLQEMFAIDYPGGRLLVTHLTHEQIAAMTGTSRVTVTRSIRLLRDQKDIDIVDGHILVRSSKEVR